MSESEQYAAAIADLYSVMPASANWIVLPNLWNVMTVGIYDHGEILARGYGSSYLWAIQDLTVTLRAQRP